MTPAEEALLAVSAMQRAAVLPPVHDDPLIIALRDRMLADPKFGYAAVTGAWSWPPVNGEHLGDLAMRAADGAYELEQRRDEGETIPQIKIDTLRAAEWAFVLLEQREREDEAEARDRADDIGSHGMWRS